MDEMLTNPIILPQWDRGAMPEPDFTAIGACETGDCVADVTPNSQIIQTYVRVLDLGPNGGVLRPAHSIFQQVIRTIPINILVGAPGWSNAPIVTRLAFMALHPLPAHIIPPSARIRIRLTAASRQRLRHSTLGRTIIGDHIEIPELLGSIGGIHLEPGESLPVLLEYQTDYLDEGSVLRVLQYAGEQDAERLIGVQVYVFTGVLLFLQPVTARLTPPAPASPHRRRTGS